MLRERRPDTGILFAGNPKGMESRLVPAAGFAFAPIEVLGFQRKPNLRNLKNNLLAAGYLLTASGKAAAIIRDFKPDVCMGTGGYVSGPVIRQAAKMKIPTLTHEQNAFPGLTTKLLTKHVDKVLLALPGAQSYLPEGIDVTVTGNPIRAEIFTADRAAARRELGVGQKVCILSFGGSLGAQKINEAVADLIAWHHSKEIIHHIHATGQYGVESFPAMLAEKGVNVAGNPRVDLRTYIEDMPRCLAAADLVICRAGAISISELQGAGRAGILIPSPNVAGNHQYHNAQELAAKNAAILLEEKDLTGQKLIELVADLSVHPEKLAEIGRGAAGMAIPDACARICAEIEALLAAAGRT